MPRFNVFQPFRSSHRDRIEQVPHDSRVSRYDGYEHSRPLVATDRSGSRWRNVLTKRGRPGNELYVNGPEYSVASEPEVRRMVQPRRTAVEDYDSQESMTTDSDNYPVRHPMPESQTRFIERVPSHESFHRENSEHYINRVPSHESFPIETMPQPSVVQTPSTIPPFVAPPGEVYMEELGAPSIHSVRNERPAYEHEPPIIQAEPRRFRARRGEPITVGNMRIEVEDDGRHSRGHRSRRSVSRSTASYSSLSSRSYSSSSVEEQPIIITADPDTRIEIGNEEDGFIPYEQYLAEREERRRRRRRHHRHTPEEEVYVIPAGTNVIFIDEDGQELHRVGEFDDRYSNRRRNTSARTTRQILPDYDELHQMKTTRKYVDQAIQTEADPTGIDGRGPIIMHSSDQQPQPNNSISTSQMHERMRTFMHSRPSSLVSPRPSSPIQEVLKNPMAFHATKTQHHNSRPTSPLFRPLSPISIQTPLITARMLR